MMSFKPKSLKSLLLLHETLFLVLVITTGIMGGIWAYFWQQTSQESIRINNLLFEAQLVRGDLYRQLKEISRARLAEDPTALNRYWRHLYQIDRYFYSLEQLSHGDSEKKAITAMRQSYELMQTEMNKLFAETASISQSVMNTILDPAYEEWVLGDFETAFTEFSRLIGEQRRLLEATLAKWTQRAPVLLTIPAILAMALLWFSHRSLRYGFIVPMRDISHGAYEFSQGRLDHTIPSHGVEEVQQLSHSINAMARDLAASRNALVEKERQAALGALVPVVAHNIRNPLASIRATAQVIDETDNAEELQETRQAIIDSVDRLERWVSSLLNYLHPLRPHRVDKDIGTIVDGALAPLMTKLEQKRLVLKREHLADESGVHVDVDLMEQAIYGLINNAADASSENQTITLIEHSNTAGVLLDIDDAGPGMPMEPRPDNLNPMPTTKRLGTGLGIPFAFKVLHAHDGSIQFSKSPAGGTRVRLFIPVTSTAKD